MSVLQGKKIVVGISGGIAAYKSPELIRLLRKAGAEVRVVVSKNALNFVTECTLQTVSNSRVYTNVFSTSNPISTEHVALRTWADAMLVAPATADCLAKFAAGIADDALSTTLLAMCPGSSTFSRIPIIVAPAMNEQMYWATPTQTALDTISKWQNVVLMDCAEGLLACGTTGKGRMQEIDAILQALQSALSKKELLGQRVLVTVGPTQEAIDPVRYITNRSTGKMGVHIVQQCLYMGANVEVVAGPLQCPLPNRPQDIYYRSSQQLSVHNVITAEEMCEKAVSLFPGVNIAILCAAVADFTCLTTAVEKIKSKNCDLTLVLSPTKDIASQLGQMKTTQTLVGFALETNNEEVNAITKLKNKNLDLIVLNSLRDAGACFGTDTNKITIYSRDSFVKTFPLLSKEQTASNILHTIIKREEGDKVNPSL